MLDQEVDDFDAYGHRIYDVPEYARTKEFLVTTYSEDNASNEYKRGYESAEAKKSVDDIRAYGIEHRAELLKIYKERKIKKVSRNTDFFFYAYYII